MFRKAAFNPMAAPTNVTTIHAWPASYESRSFRLQPNCPSRSKKPAFSFRLALLLSCSLAASCTQSIVVKSSYLLIFSISSVNSCSVLPVGAPCCPCSALERADSRLDILRSGKDGRGGGCAEKDVVRAVISSHHCSNVIRKVECPHHRATLKRLSDSR